MPASNQQSLKGTVSQNFSIGYKDCSHMDCIDKFNVLDPDTPFGFHADPERAFHTDADPDLVYQLMEIHADPDQQHW
jgi:hypothetical protein